MGAKRQNIQLELAFAAEVRGEAPSAVGGGTEVPRAGCGTESLAERERLMERVCERENVAEALRRVMGNKGAPGVDGMRVEELPGYLAEHWPRIEEQLLSGTYKPRPVRRVEIPKRGGGRRKLGIPTALDRLIQQAVLQVLQPRWDPTFSEHSFGFRPGRSAHQAIAQAQEYIAEGYRWVVDVDLEKFFDRVNHDKLMSLVAGREKDKRLLKLVRAFLEAGIMEEGLVSSGDAVRPTEGTPQGGPLSPLLSNLLLDLLDRELERRGHRFVRYADDCNIYVRSERAGRRVMVSITRFIERKLKLKVNREKSGVDKVHRLSFLGFSFTAGKTLKRRIAGGSVERFKERVREITQRTRGRSLEGVVAELARYLRGWIEYYGFCQTPWVLRRLDGWVRRRLRSLAWVQWRGGRRRYAELRRLGVSRERAHKASSSSRGPWRLSHTGAVQVGLSEEYLHSLGLISLAARVEA